MNLRSIGIEHEAGPAMPPSEALYAASARLHLEIADRHGLDLSVGTTVLPHNAMRAIRSVFPNADISGPDVESGQPFRS